jgi:hypothetical protein
MPISVRNADICVDNREGYRIIAPTPQTKRFGALIFSTPRLDKHHFIQIVTDDLSGMVYRKVFFARAYIDPPN